MIASKHLGLSLRNIYMRFLYLLLEQQLGCTGPIGHFICSSWPKSYVDFFFAAMAAAPPAAAAAAPKQGV